MGRMLGYKKLKNDGGSRIFRTNNVKNYDSVLHRYSSAGTRLEFGTTVVVAHALTN